MSPRQTFPDPLCPSTRRCKQRQFLLDEARPWTDAHDTCRRFAIGTRSVARSRPRGGRVMATSTDDMSIPVTRGELREEIQQLKLRFEQKLEQKLAHLATKTELEMWGERCWRASSWGSSGCSQLARHTRAIQRFRYLDPRDPYSHASHQRHIAPATWTIPSSPRSSSNRSTRSVGGAQRAGTTTGGSSGGGALPRTRGTLGTRPHRG